jgi:hypothetical protein
MGSSPTALGIPTTALPCYTCGSSPMAKVVLLHTHALCLAILPSKRKIVLIHIKEFHREDERVTPWY